MEYTSQDFQPLTFDFKYPDKLPESWLSASTLFNHLKCCQAKKKLYVVGNTTSEYTNLKKLYQTVHYVINAHCITRTVC